MDATTRDNIVMSCLRDLKQYNLAAGIDTLKNFVVYCSDKSLVDKAESIAENYAFMLTFLSKGGKDDNRMLVQEKIACEGIELANMASRNIRIDENVDNYAKTFHRLEENYGKDFTSAIINRWNALPSPEELSVLQDDIFHLLWTSPLWNAHEMQEWYDFIERQNDLIQRHFLSAIFLSTWEYPDKEKMTLLSLCTNSSYEDVSDAASVFTVMLVQKYRDIPFTAKLATCNRGALKKAFEVQKNLLLIRVTLREIEKMEAEVEQLEEVKSDYLRYIRGIMEIRMKFMQNSIKKGLDSNITNRMTMWHRCKFLKDISHWWLPFDKNHPLIQDLIIDEKGNVKKEISAVIDNIGDCDVDKFTLLDYLNNTKGGGKILSEIENSLPEGHELARTKQDIIRNTIQNMFRFFQHSELRKETASPFVWSTTMWENELLQASFSMKQAEEICDLLADSEQFSTALRCTNLLIEKDGASAKLLRLQGLCYEELKFYRKAIESYKQSEFLEDDNMWNLLHIQQCYKELNMPMEQIEYLRKMAHLEESNLSILQNIALTMITCGMYEEAINILYELDYKQPNDIATMTSLVHCALFMGKHDVARKYNNKLLAMDYPQKWMEHLTAGHIFFIEGDWMNALSCYKEFLDFVVSHGTNDDEAMKLFDKDTEILKDNGIGEMDIKLMRDMLLQKER